MRGELKTSAYCAAGALSGGIVHVVATDGTDHMRHFHLWRPFGSSSVCGGKAFPDEFFRWARLVYDERALHELLQAPAIKVITTEEEIP